jgi:hypothetical protein
MDWLQFIDGMVGHLAWPLIVLIVVFAIRKHLGSLADRILELSFGGATMKFGNLLSKGAELIERAPPLPTPVAPKTVPHVHVEGSELPHGNVPPTEAQLEEILKQLQPIIAGQSINPAPPAPTMGSTFKARDITRSWNALEMVIDQLAEPLGVKTRSGDTIMTMLRKRMLVSPEAVELYKTLREARGEVVHGGSPNESQIAEFVRQAGYLLMLLRAALQQIHDPGPGI